MEDNVSLQIGIYESTIFTRFEDLLNVNLTHFMIQNSIDGGDIIIDNQSQDQNIIMLLGSDLNTTAFEVQNNSGLVQFSVNGSGNTDITGTLSLNNSELTATVDELNTLNISASTEEITEAGAITLNKSLVKLNTTTGSFTITLDSPNAPQHGKTMIIQMTNDTNNVQLTPTNIIGLSEINNPTFSNINDTLVLLGIEGKWLVIKEYGITFT